MWLGGFTRCLNSCAHLPWPTRGPGCHSQGIHLAGGSGWANGGRVLARRGQSGPTRSQGGARKNPPHRPGSLCHHRPLLPAILGNNECLIQFLSLYIFQETMNVGADLSSSSVNPCNFTDTFSLFGFTPLGLYFTEECCMISYPIGVVIVLCRIVISAELSICRLYFNSF